MVCWLGCGTRALELYETLGIKQVQYDTLSYLITDSLVTFGFAEEAAQQVEIADTIYESNNFEVGHCMKRVMRCKYLVDCPLTATNARSKRHRR